MDVLNLRAHHSVPQLFESAEMPDLLNNDEHVYHYPPERQ
jgi:hypothetical protein